MCFPKWRPENQLQPADAPQAGMTVPSHCRTPKLKPTPETETWGTIARKIIILRHLWA